MPLTAARRGGVVVEVIGDDALAAFGLSQADGAAAAAIGFARAVAGSTGPPLRAGGHPGPVAMADIGGGGRVRLTLARDTVDVAARPLDSARVAKRRVAVSRALIDVADPAEAAGMRPLGVETLRGRAQPVGVWGG